MTQPVYIHGTDTEEQTRLARLNALTNPPFLRFLELQPSDCVLEVGSGLGLLASEVAARVPQGTVVGVEFSSAQLSRSSRTVRNVRFTQGDAHNLPFPANTFDLVYCRYVLEHVHEPTQVLQEMYRVLKPGGRVSLQENDTALTLFDPDCPASDALIGKFVTLQARLGGDGRIGKRLFGLCKRAGFREISLSYQPEVHTADEDTFTWWVENILAILNGASEALITFGLATILEIAAAEAELSALLLRPDASALFHWNRATARK